MNIFFALLAEGSKVVGALPDISEDIARLDYRAVLLILAIIMVLAFADRPKKGG